MKNCILISFAFLINLGLIKAQEEAKQKFYLGGYYTVLIESYILEATSDSVHFTQHFININLRYALNHKWRFGIESIVSFVPFEGIEDPFYVIGLTADYDVLRAKRSKLNLRGGISFGNLLYAGDFVPKRRNVINRVIGISYEFRITQAIWLNGGLYGHRPLNSIPDKYALVQPFIGACIGI